MPIINITRDIKVDEVNIEGRKECVENIIIPVMNKIGPHNINLNMALLTEPLPGMGLLQYLKR